MLCERAHQNNNITDDDDDPWMTKNSKHSGAPSSLGSTHKTSAKQYSSGANLVPEISLKTSGSSEATSITPEKDHDVEMGEADEGAAATAVAVSRGSEAADNSDDSSDEEEFSSNGDKDVVMEDANKDKTAEGEASSTTEMKKSKPKKSSNGGSGDGNKSDEDGAAKSDNIGNGSKKSEDATKKKKASTSGSGSSAKKEEPAEEIAANYPLLVGTLAYSDRDNLRRHIIRGNWKYENSVTVAPQPFELIRIIPPEETLEELPKDGEFNGSFNVQMQQKNSKGKLKLKNRAVTESGVKLIFKEKNDSDGEKFSVNGMGTNEYGTFELFGTAKENTEAGSDQPTYKVSVYKKYVGPPPAKLSAAASKKSGEGKKDKKRKHVDTAASGEDEDLPPPTELPEEGITLRGKLVRNTSDELSLDNTAVHKIAGLWAMKGLSNILEDPDACEKFEYEHKCMGDSTVFPLSGRYTGFFHVNEAGERTKIAERDVTLKFRRNNAGYHNVDGRGSNIFGKYNITGTLQKDGTITLFRHFQALKVKASKKGGQVKIAAPGANGSSSKIPPKPKAFGGAGAAAAAPPSNLLTFDDVNLPEGDGPIAPLNPPDQFTATMRGILKIENDGTHTCSGTWAMTNEHFQSGITSKYHFGVAADNAADDAKIMLDEMEEAGEDEKDDRRIKNMASDGISPVTLANSTFPIDSTRYKGSFKLRKGATRTQTIVDNQIVLKYVKNSGGSYNVYGKGTNEMGTFDLVGTLIQQGKSNGLMQLYRMYPPAPEPAAVTHQATKKSSKVFQGGLTEKATAANSAPAPAMKPPERFTPSMSGLQRERRESSRMSRLPSRLEESDPQAQMERFMERCRVILKELQESDVQKIFGAPVDPIALGIPTYFDVIADPMDLGTIRTRMDNGEVDSPEEFSRLVRLTFNNAIAFNTMPDNIVHICARNLSALFNKKFGSIDKAYQVAKANKKLTKAERLELKRKEKEAAKDIKRKAKDDKERKRKAEVEATNESKRMKLENVLVANRSTMAAIARAAPVDPDANMTRVEFNLLVEAIKQVQDQIVGLHKLVKKQSKTGGVAAVVPSAPGAADNSHGKADSDSEMLSSHAPKQPKKKKPKKEQPPVEPEEPEPEEPEPEEPESPSPKDSPPASPVEVEMSFEEQEALSQSINDLPERLLPGAMQIIRESDCVNDDDDEIDLDIDQLDTRTQRKLQRFVMENVKTKKPKKQPKKRQSKKQKEEKAAASAPAPAAPPSPPPSPPEEAEESKPKSRLPGGKSLFSYDNDDDSDDDDNDDEEENLEDFATNWVANPPTTAKEDPEEKDAATEDKADPDKGDADKDDDGSDSEPDLWNAAQVEAKAAKARDEDKRKREEKVIQEAERNKQKRLEEAAKKGDEIRAKREEQEAAEALRLEEEERKAEEAREAARKAAQQEVEEEQPSIDIGDEQRKIMEEFEQGWNDYGSAGGASPASDFGF